MGDRRGLAVVAAVVAAAVALVSALVLVQAQPGMGAATSADSGPMLAPALEQQPDAVPDPADLPALGIQFHGTWSHYDDAKRRAVIAKIVESGSTWVRLDIGWPMIQPQPGRYGQAWGVPKVDRVIDELRSNGLKVLGMFWLSPTWATSAPGPLAETDIAQFYPPTDPADYAQAIGWAAERWAGEVDAWEVWNEPNLDHFYRGTDPQQYADMLCQAYPAVHRADPEAQVVFGGLMFNDVEWLRQAYHAGVAGCFDVMAVHSYQTPADAPPDAEDDGSEWSLGHLDELRSLMLSQGDDVPVWITEFGWSVHEDPPGAEPWERGVSEAEQARYAAEALRLMGQEFPYVEAAFWYKDVANSDSTDPHQEGYAMLRRDLTARPLLQAFRDLYGRF
ncbi:cellulase family glycosylhydrolase [Nocardioides litoris]|uniref:cellulase family glycosylhydrolase n=1 Tax=Nocardioides litoris TaxID=1926648 RepID=UPI00111FF47B|nr:cellulase family glycosylhydrolase [Nocardioides litoris]